MGGCAEQLEGSSHGVSDGNISPVIMDQFGWEKAIQLLFDFEQLVVFEGDDFGTLKLCAPAFKGYIQK